MGVTIVADDLTGACDTGAVFAGRGAVGVYVRPALPSARWPAAAVDTESRTLAPEAAAGEARRAARALGDRVRAGRVFKKIDSTMRGPIGAEIDAWLDAAGLGGALICPALPEQQRTVVGRELLVGGVPAHATPVGTDPDFPPGTSDVVRILESQSRRRVRHLPLEVVRAPADALARALAAGNGGLAVADAETPADLDALARVALGMPALLLAGSAGLARAAAELLGYAGPPPALPGSGAWLVIAGSQHAASRAQIDALLDAGIAAARIDSAAPDLGAPDLGAPDLGWVIQALAAGRPAILTTPVEPRVLDARLAGTRGAGPPPGGRAAMADALAAAARAVIAAARPALLCVTGGATAAALMRALGASHLELAGAPARGLALGALVVPDAAPLPVLTKAGGFGAPDLYLQLMSAT